MTHPLVTLAILLVCSCVLPSAAQGQVETVPAGAQPKTPSMVKTTKDRVLVWSRNPSAVIATLPQGIVIEAIARDAQWYQVRVPEKYAGTGGAIGFVYKGHLELVEGPEPPLRAPEATASQMARGPRRKAPPPPTFGARGYGTVSVDWFTASDSFKAILDQSNGVFYGGGGQVIYRHFFVDASFEHFEKTGERAIVVNGNVFRLGIPDTITMDPFRVIGGYRFPTQNNVTPYAGGGIGSLHFQETSEFAAADETTDERFTSYHVVAGAEYALKKWLWIAGEVRYASVPDAVGAPGIAADFDESNLGGFGVAVKVLVGK
jgi:opacity protein-like surface antigen